MSTFVLTSVDAKEVELSDDLQGQYLEDPVSSLEAAEVMPPHMAAPQDLMSLSAPSQVPTIEESRSAVLISEENILKIPEDQFPPNLAFRPGCAVICMDHNKNRPVPRVTYGTVLYAAVDLRSRTRAYVYKVQATRRPSGEPFFVREGSLHFAQATPVWVKISTEYEEGYTFASSQKAHNEMPVYSVTRVSDQGLYTDIPGSRVKVRISGSSKPADDEQDIRSMLSQTEEAKGTVASSW
eukprot:CAMPEP_0119015262 /NCGR_PEP_ID=MMETSP1176-20130426/10713_1 /TAXON_ID=265551 /ORGANISM="Synedropsis recta cf, Strain CCMP1620" /LENGTH=238 /DNA_ID=CAMNT_0006968541 /DNA_START=31 /DNA_END=744 /DNA_ORIENTATION=+